eukprot:359459-Chlamydomonas_euryale.AAC.12
MAAWPGLHGCMEAVAWPRLHGHGSMATVAWPHGHGGMAAWPQRAIVAMDRRLQGCAEADACTWNHYAPAVLPSLSRNGSGAAWPRLMPLGPSMVRSLCGAVPQLWGPSVVRSLCWCIDTCTFGTTAV